MDNYSILGLSSGASEAQIKSAYRKLAMQWHPDKNPGNKAAESTFKLISGAYTELTKKVSSSAPPRTPNQTNGATFEINLTVTQMCIGALANIAGTVCWIAPGCVDGDVLIVNHHRIVVKAQTRHGNYLKVRYDLRLNLTVTQRDINKRRKIVLEKHPTWKTYVLQLTKEMFDGCTVTMKNCGCPKKNGEKGALIITLNVISSPNRWISVKEWLLKSSWRIPLLVLGIEAVFVLLSVYI